MTKARRKIYVLLSIGSVALILLATGLPMQSNIFEEVEFISKHEALFRQLQRDTTWHNWWPGAVETSNKRLILHSGDFKFTVEKMFLNKIEFQISEKDFSIPATFVLTPKSGDSIMLSLQSVIDLNHNPINRIKELLISSKLKAIFKNILIKESEYFSSIKNLYDFDIEETTVPFEYVSALNKNFPYEPSLKEQYAIVDEVKEFIKKYNGKQIGMPMLNITQTGRNEFFTQVAIPVDRKLPENGKIKSKWLLKGGNILSTKVVGGKQIILKAKNQMENYMLENHKSSIAIPFEYLITNRIEQSDSSKWITKIYFPVF